MPRKSRKPATAEVSTPDSVLLETPLGRENDFGLADRGTLSQDEVVHPEVGARPMSSITGRHDEGSGANETVDGLDEYGEAIRHAAEDIPAAERPNDDLENLPVFDRADAEPKV